MARKALATAKKTTLKKEKTVKVAVKVKATKKPVLKTIRKLLKAEAGLKKKPSPKKKEVPLEHPSTVQPILSSAVVVPKEITPVKPIAVKKAVRKKEKAIAAAEPIATAPEIKEKVKVVPRKEIKPAQAPEKPLPVKEPAVPTRVLELNLPITVKDLAIRLQEKPSLLIKSLMGIGVMAGINQTLQEDTVVKICQKYGYQLQKAPEEEELALRIHQGPDIPKSLRPRSPIVTFMGHVDHGKTSLLDAIRKTKVAESEHGGITQHIGAYRVTIPQGEITFLDTPGHEAFTAMRARGAKATDIVVLVVAADDGIMPQTQEAIDHARAAGVPIIVALNKIDKPQADVDRVKKQLAGLDLMAEDWGGKTITVAVSAKTGQGIDGLLEMIILEAQMLELKANPQRPANGVVIEAKLTKGRGPVATLLVQNGTLHLGEVILADKCYGKIKAMCNDRGQAVANALPSMAVEVSGLSGVPVVGEPFFVIEEEKTARGLALKRAEKEKQQQLKSGKRISLEDLHTQIKEGKLKELKMILKADVQGSLEAIKETLNKLNVTEIKWSIIHEGVGSINTSDVILAIASDALILGFHVDIEGGAGELSNKEGVDIKTYNIIYELANDITAALEGMLEPKLKKIFLGRVEIRKVLKLSRAGIVAGCFVTKGKITRNASVSLVRNGETVFDGKVSSLKRFKDDVREVAEGFECGITLSGFDSIMEGDIIEAYETQSIARKIGDKA